jgi:hypothetical protein
MFKEFSVIITFSWYILHSYREFGNVHKDEHYIAYVHISFALGPSGLEYEQFCLYSCVQTGACI